MTTRRINLPIARVLCACALLLASHALWLPAAFGEGEVTKHTITPSAGPNGTIDPDQAVQVMPGDDLTLTATAAAGHEVDVWSVDGSEVQTGGTGLTLTDIQADHAVHVVFKPLEYDVTSSAGANSHVTS